MKKSKRKRATRARFSRSLSRRLGPASSKLEPSLPRFSDAVPTAHPRLGGHIPRQMRYIEQQFPSGATPLLRGSFLPHVRHDLGTGLMSDCNDSATVVPTQSINVVSPANSIGQ